MYSVLSYIVLSWPLLPPPRIYQKWKSVFRCRPMKSVSPGELFSGNFSPPTASENFYPWNLFYLDTYGKLFSKTFLRRIWKSFFRKSFFRELRRTFFRETIFNWHVRKTFFRKSCSVTEICFPLYTFYIRLFS